MSIEDCWWYCRLPSSNRRIEGTGSFLETRLIARNRTCKRPRPMDVFQLASNHVWKAAVGCRVLVVDNGGVRLDIPDECIVYSPKRHVFVFDRLPPESRLLLAI